MIIKHHYHKQYSATHYVYACGRDYNHKYKLHCTVCIAQTHTQNAIFYAFAGD